MNQKNKKSRYLFGKYLKNVRKKLQFSQETLCEGLCTTAQLSRIESGVRIPKKLLLNALMSRLGISIEDHEHFLDEEEYRGWSMRQNILRAMIEQRLTDAREALEVYRSECVEENTLSLEQQFCDSIEAQICQSENMPEAYILEKFQQALKTTVPCGWDCPLKGHSFSVTEINLLLEIARYGESAVRLSRYREIVDWLNHIEWESIPMTQIYPKVIYYLYLELYQVEKKTNGGALSMETAKSLLVYCNQAIRLLRCHERTYYLWEILEARLTCIHSVETGLRQNGMDQKMGNMKLLAEETKGWMNMLQDICRRLQTPVIMHECCYLYTEKNIYRIRDVILARRRMLGLSKEKLAEDICTVNVLRRMERGEKTQRELLDQMQLKLNLPAEYCQFEVISDDPDVHIWMSKLRRNRNDGNTDESSAFLEKIKTHIPIELPLNRQVILREKAILDLFQDTCGMDSFLRQIKNILEMTIPAVYDMGSNVYFTCVEIECLQNMIAYQKADTQEMRKYLQLLYHMFSACDEQKNAESFINRYELSMEIISNRLGDWGEYTQSAEISMRIMREDMLCHRLCMISSEIYNLLWLDEQTKKEPSQMLMSRAKEDLNLCTLISSFTMKKTDEKFFREKLKKLG